MDNFEDDCPDRLLAPHAPPCVSSHRPTHPADPDEQQDPIRFRSY